MKLCFLVHNIFNLGGIQRVVSVLANELIKNHEIDIICIEKDFKVDRSIYKLDEKIRIVNGSKLYNKKIYNKIISKIGVLINNNTGIFNEKFFENISKEIYFPKRVRNNFIEYFNKENYDVVIAVEGFYSILLGTISDMISSKTIGWQHNSYDAYFNLKNKYCWNMDKMFKRYISKLDKYIVLTKYDKCKFKEEMNIDCTVIYNPRSFNSKIKADITKKQFLAAGRFDYQKGFDLLIESFNEFSKINDEWNLVIVGEGKEKKIIEELIKKYKLEKRIRIESFTNDIRNYFLQTSVLLLPSRWEGMPMIVLEAFEMGMPIISYDITASQQLIKDKSEGILIEKFNIKQFANAMNELATNYDIRETFSNNSIKKSSKFAIDQIMTEWNNILLDKKWEK